MGERIPDLNSVFVGRERRSSRLRVFLWNFPGLGVCSGCPSAKPVAAIPTVLMAQS